MGATQVRSGQVLDGSLTDADVAAANKDGTAGTPSMRTLGAGALQACAGNDSRLTAMQMSLYGVTGFILSYSSTTVFNVGLPTGLAGTCADNTNAVQITLSSRTSVNITTDGAIGGNDSFTGGGTCTASASATITGSGTAFKTSFAPGGVPRSGDGTITSAAAVVTGTGTFFMDGPNKLALGDLIGNTTSGYFQVIAIADNTHCTINATPGTPFSTSSWKVIENPTIKFSGNATIYQVLQINSDTSIIINTTVTVSAVAYIIGKIPTNLSKPSTTNTFGYVWVGVGGTGTGCFISTQRTTPFTITGYTTNVRRIGRLLINAGAIVFFEQWGSSNERWYQYEVDNGTLGTRVVAAGSNTVWTTIICSAVIAPVDVSLSFTITEVGAVDGLSFVRPRNSGSTSLSRALKFNCTNANGTTYTASNIPMDGAQCIDYVNTANNVFIFIDVFGAMEIL